MSYDTAAARGSDSDLYLDSFIFFCFLVTAKYINKVDLFIYLDVISKIYTNTSNSYWQKMNEKHIQCTFKVNPGTSLILWKQHDPFNKWNASTLVPIISACMPICAFIHPRTGSQNKQLIKSINQSINENIKQWQGLYFRMTSAILYYLTGKTNC